MLMLSYAVFLTVIIIFIEWLVGPSLVQSLFDVRWIERSDDPVLWSMVHEEAAKAGVKVRKIGIVNDEAPNAFVYAFITGRPHLVFTKGLLIGMTYPEVRNVACYLIGNAKSGGLSLLTTLTGLLTIPYGIAGGYIKARLEGRRLGYGNLAAAAVGYIYFILAYPQINLLSRVMSIFGDEYSIMQTENPSSFISALIKTSAGCAMKPMDSIRTRTIPLKSLMFQDPTMAIRDANVLRETAVKWEINLERLMGLKDVSFPKEEDYRFHTFERFWTHPDLVDRLGHAFNIGKKIQAPIKIGLSWIE